jgi:hypothetical protein
MAQSVGDCMGSSMPITTKGSVHCPLLERHSTMSVKVAVLLLWNLALTRNRCQEISHT